MSTKLPPKQLPNGAVKSKSLVDILQVESLELSTLNRCQPLLKNWWSFLCLRHNYFGFPLNKPLKLLMSEHKSPDEECGALNMHSSNMILTQLHFYCAPTCSQCRRDVERILERWVNRVIVYTQIVKRALCPGYLYDKLLLWQSIWISHWGIIAHPKLPSGAQWGCMVPTAH